MDFSLTADDKLCRFRNVSLFFILQVFVLGLAYYTSGTYLFFGGIKNAPLLIVSIAFISSAIAYVVAQQSSSDFN